MNEENLRAYLATALTGLQGQERAEVFEASGCIGSVCERSGVALYQPRLQTDPVEHSQVAPRDVYLTDRERVVTSDLVIALCTQPRGVSTTLRHILTEFSEFFHVSWTGLLIQASVGTAGGLGALRTKRSG